MPYLLVSDFQGGQDVRKSEFTAPPGTLRRLVNGHITRGGEIEKRKTFDEAHALPAGTHGLHSVNGRLVVYGLEDRPAGLDAEIIYYKIQSESAPSGIDRVLSTDNFGGAAYAVVQFNDGAVEHYYGDQRVTAWDAITLDVASREALADALVSRINSSSVFTANAVAGGADPQFTITGPVEESFTVEPQAVNDTSWSFSVATTQEASAPSAAQSAETVLTVTGGTESGGNEVSSITVAGVEILGSAVPWQTSNDDTAAAIAAQINTHTSDPEYTATASGADVTVIAPAGAAANGRVVVVSVGGDVTTSAPDDLAGGQDAMPALPQISEVTILEDPDGSRLASAYYSIGLAVDGGGSTETYMVRLTETAVATFVKTVADQMYGAAQVVLRYTGFRVTGGNPVGQADPTAWDTSAEDVVNAGLIDMSSQDGSNEDVVAVGTYQNRIAIFSRRYIQIWAVGPAPEDKQQIQVLNNLGTISPQTVTSFGDQDVFFLSESGVRSLRARDSSNLASAADVGNPIDPELVDFALQQSRETIEKAVAIVEPTNGRYWLSLADRMYVFSFFGSSKVSAWSTYELPGVIDAVALSAGRVFFRSGDVVYRYGGEDNRTYDDAEVEVRTPFMDADNPAQHKSWTGLDIGCEGVWRVWVATDPEQPEVEEEIGVFGKASFSQLRVAMVGYGSHISIRLRSVGPGYHKLTNLAIHYESNETG